MGDTVRIGVIGAGWFASRRHLPDIEHHPEATLAALCRRDEQALGKLAAHFGPERTYTDWRAMLDDCPMDAVLVATPHNLHYEPIRAALERGLHVLAEKPLTLRAEEARELCDLAASQKLVLAVALNPPYWAHCHRIRRAIQSGRIGSLEAVHMHWTGNAGYVFGEAPRPPDLPGLVAPTMFRADPEQCGGGYLEDGGAHLVSEVLWVSGARAKQVSCVMDRTPSDRRAALWIELEGDTIATISCVGDSRFAARRVWNTFAGSSGTVTVEGVDFQTTIGPAGGEAESFCERDLPKVSSPVANLVDAICQRAEPFSPGSHGLHVVEVLEAAYRSAGSGAAVPIPPQASA